MPTPTVKAALLRRSSSSQPVLLCTSGHVRKHWADTDGSTAPILDTYTKRSSEPLDWRDIRSISDTLTLWGIPVTRAVQQTYGTDLVRVNLVAETLVAAR